MPLLASIFQASLVVASLAAVLAAIASILFLRSRDFFHDSLALAVTEIGLAILAAGIVTGSIAYQETIRWWTWDASLTTALVCFLLYAPYLMLRNAIEEPTRRAASAAVVSIFAVCNIPAIAVTIGWWLPHSRPLAVPPVETAVLVIAGGFAAVFRLRQEQRRRAADAARRTSQEI